MSKHTFQSRKKTKVEKNKEFVDLVIDYENIDSRDVYGLYLTNRTTKFNSKSLPDIGSFVNQYPDYFVLDSEPGLFDKTNASCVCFFKDDSYFDTIDGLYNAIIYKDVELLKFYKNRYKNVKYFIPADYSLYGDFDEEQILHNIKKEIILYLWFTFECNGIVFPLMTYGLEDTFSWCFEYIMKGSNICVSLKGVMDEPERGLFIKALKVLVDTRTPKALIVYTVVSKESSDLILNYAILKEIPIIYVQNTLQERNCGGSK
jgi:glutaredoxin-related protein